MVKVERLAQKLHIMSFIGNFSDNIHQLQPVGFSNYYFTVIFAFDKVLFLYIIIYE